MSGKLRKVPKSEDWFPGVKGKEFARLGNSKFVDWSKSKASDEDHGGRSPAGLEGKSTGDEQ